MGFTNVNENRKYKHMKNIYIFARNDIKLRKFVSMIEDHKNSLST